MPPPSVSFLSDNFNLIFKAEVQSLLTEFLLGYRTSEDDRLVANR